MSPEPAELVLAAARRAVADAVAAGGPEPDLTTDRLTAALEADAAARAGLDEAAVARRRREQPLDAPQVDARSQRHARADEAQRAVGDLVVAGELQQDGPGRLRLPGFGPSTWRAVAVLVRDPAGPQAPWAAAVAHDPLGDLGDALPAALRPPPPRPEAADAARRILALEAHRQDLRHALISGEAAAAGARERGEEAAALLVEADCATLRDAVAEIDAVVEEAWREGSGPQGA
jgi:hypothetical protein